MIKSSDIDLTENSDFSKENTFNKVHVENGIIHHPRIPWKIDKERSCLKRFYSTDGDFTYVVPTVTNLYDTYFDNDLYNIQFLGLDPILSLYHATTSSINTITYSYSGTNTWTTAKYCINNSMDIESTDIFGLKHKKPTHISQSRIPNEIKAKTEYITIFSSNRLPKIFKRPKNKYYGFPDELFYEHPIHDNNHDMYKNSRRYYKGIPWLNGSRNIIRVGERKSERGVVMYYE